MVAASRRRAGRRRGKGKQDGARAAGHPSCVASRAAEQCNVILLVFFPSTREDNFTSLDATHSTSLRGSARFHSVQDGSVGQQRGRFQVGVVM